MESIIEKTRGRQSRATVPLTKKVCCSILMVEAGGDLH
jgi:hypothetical protein